MVLSKRGICAFGWKAHDFALKGVDGKTSTLADVLGYEPGSTPFASRDRPGAPD